MLSLLEKLFEKYRINPKDRYEITQIYGLLPTEKKKHIIENFKALQERIKKIQEDMRLEQEILIGDAISNIKNIIFQTKNK